MIPHSLLTLLRKKSSESSPLDPPDFSPADLPGLALWLDASDESTITHDTGAVSQWDDKSANAYTFTQGTGSLQPTTGSTSQNSLNTLSFAADYLVSTASAITWKFLHDGTSHEVFAVWKPGVIANPDARYALMSTSGAVTESGMYFVYDDRSSASRNDVAQHVVNNTANPRAVINTTASGVLAANAHQLVRVASDPDNGTAASRSSISVNNGTATAANTQTGTASAAAPSFTLHIGVTADGTGFTFDLVGEIAEIVIYSRALTGDEIDDVQGYLATKWGLTLS